MEDKKEKKMKNNQWMNKILEICLVLFVTITPLFPQMKEVRRFVPFVIKTYISKHNQTKLHKKIKKVGLQ